MADRKSHAGLPLRRWLLVAALVEAGLMWIASWPSSSAGGIGALVLAGTIACMAHPAAKDSLAD